jgi:hypothetical protein
MRPPLLLLLALSLCGPLARGAPPAELELGDLPAEIQKAITSERPQRGRTFVSVSVTRHDLNRDGNEEWLVAATPRDAAGFVQLNRPTWIFTREGTRWRRLAYLGAPARAAFEADGVRALSRDGARTHCAFYRWQRDHLEAGPCPPAGQKP